MELEIMIDWAIGCELLNVCTNLDGTFTGTHHTEHACPVTRSNEIKVIRPSSDGRYAYFADKGTISLDMVV
jgi:hypothetical protein